MGIFQGVKPEGILITEMALEKRFGKGKKVVLER